MRMILLIHIKEGVKISDFRLLIELWNWDTLRLLMIKLHRLMVMAHTVKQVN